MSGKVHPVQILLNQLDFLETHGHIKRVEPQLRDNAAVQIREEDTNLGMDRLEIMPMEHLEYTDLEAILLDLVEIITCKETVIMGHHLGL